MKVLKLLSLGFVITGALAVSEASARDGRGRGGGGFRGVSMNRGFVQRPMFVGERFHGRGFDRARFDRRRFVHPRFNHRVVFTNPNYYPYSYSNFYPSYTPYGAGYYGYNPSYYSGVGNYGSNNYGYGNYGYSQPNYAYCIPPPTQVVYIQPQRTRRVTRVAREKCPPAVASSNTLEVQMALKEKGFDPGPINGVKGSRTRAAIRSFQRKCGLSPTGEINKPLLRSLGI